MKAERTERMLCEGGGSYSGDASISHEGRGLSATSRTWERGMDTVFPQSLLKESTFDFRILAPRTDRMLCRAM